MRALERAGVAWEHIVPLLIPIRMMKLPNAHMHTPSMSYKYIYKISMSYIRMVSMMS